MGLNKSIQIVINEKNPIVYLVAGAIAILFFPVTIIYVAYLSDQWIRNRAGTKRPTRYLLAVGNYGLVALILLFFLTSAYHAVVKSAAQPSVMIATSAEPTIDPTKEFGLALTRAVETMTAEYIAQHATPTPTLTFTPSPSPTIAPTLAPSLSPTPTATLPPESCIGLSPDYTGRVDYIYPDGTIGVQTETNGLITVELFGIKFRVKDQWTGMGYLRDMVWKKQVTLYKDPYYSIPKDNGIIYRYAMLDDGTIINYEMIASGHAETNKDQVFQGTECYRLFSSAEALAKSSKIGLWGENYQYIAPSPTPAN